MATQPVNLKHPRPESGLVGWASAWAVLDRIENDRQREALSLIVRHLGVHGAPALEAAAHLSMWLCGLGLYQAPRKALKPADFEYIERRVREELAQQDPKLFPRMKKL